MKEIKIYNIIWNTENVSKELVDNLPKYKCFTAKDDFDVVGRGPEILKKKYGVPVVCFTYSILRVVHTTEDLIMLAAPKGEKPKKIFTKTGEETDYGKKLIAEIKLAVARRKEMEAQNITVDKIPAFYDEVMIAIENITAMEWDACTAEEIITELDACIDVIKDELCQQAAQEKERLSAMRKHVKMMNKSASDDDDEFDEDDE